MALLVKKEARITAKTDDDNCDRTISSVCTSKLPRFFLVPGSSQTTIVGQNHRSTGIRSSHGDCKAAKIGGAAVSRQVLSAAGASDVRTVPGRDFRYPQLGRREHISLTSANSIPLFAKSSFNWVSLKPAYSEVMAAAQKNSCPARISTSLNICAVVALPPVWCPLKRFPLHHKSNLLADLWTKKPRLEKS